MVVPDHDSLDPSAKPFSVVLHVKFKDRPDTGTYALLNKGSPSVRSYAAFINSAARPVCLFHGSLKSASVAGPNARQLYIGRGPTGGNRYAGVMDEVTIRVGS